MLFLPMAVMLAWAGGSLSWVCNFFYPVLHPSQPPNSWHLLSSDFDKWGLWRKKGTLSHWRVVWLVMGGVILGYREEPHFNLPGRGCSLPGTRMCTFGTNMIFSWYSTSSTLRAFTFLTRSIQRCILHLPVWAVTQTTKVVFFLMFP